MSTQAQITPLNYCSHCGQQLTGPRLEILDLPLTAPLSRRETELVHLVAQGYPNRDIAAKLCISTQTVKNHLHTIFGKVQCRNRLGLALWAVATGTYER